MVGGGHEATSVTAEAITTEPTAQDNQVQAEAATAEDTTASSTEELGPGEVKFIRVNGTKLTWSYTDFDISNGTVNGFSDTGLAKAKTMAEEDELSFPEEVTKINQNAFIYSKYEDELPNGIVGKVRFHKNITSIGNSAFQGNPEINEVIIEDGESIFFGGDAFNPARKPIGVDYQNYDGNVAAFEGVERSKLTSLVIGKRKFNAYGRAFAKSSIKSIDFSNATGNGFTLNDKGEKIYSSIADIEQLVFFDSAIEEIVSFGKIGYINYGAFANCELKKVNITKDLYTIGHKAFMNNANLTELTFDERTADDPGVEIRGDAFFGTNISGTVAFPNNVQVTVWGGDRNGGNPGFKGNKITKLVHSDQGGVLGWNTFEFNPIETIENLYPRHYFESSLFANSEALKNVSFVSFDKYVDKRITGIPNNAFGNGKLKSVELPDHFTSIAGNAYQNNLGWIDGDTRVALYRKNADGYVTDNAVADGSSFVINPVVVRVKMVNQLGNEITNKDIVLNAEVTNRKKLEGGEEKEILTQISKEANTSEFKLGDAITFNIPDVEGLKLEKVNKTEIEKDASFNKGAVSLTIDPSEVEEVNYGDGYKVGYKRYTITLAYNDPSAIPPYFPFFPDEPVVTPVDSVNPIGPENPVNPENPINPETPVGPVNPETPVSPETPELPVDSDDSTSGENVVNPMDTEEDDSEIVAADDDKAKEEEVETVLVDGDETPKSDATVSRDKAFEEADLGEGYEEIESLDDETPRGSANLGGNTGKNSDKKDGKKADANNKVVAVLAKTGGKHIMLYQMGGIFAILLLGYGFFELKARKKKEA